MEEERRGTIGGSGGQKMDYRWKWRKEEGLGGGGKKRDYRWKWRTEDGL